MAELDIRQIESNIYGNVEDCELFLCSLDILVMMPNSMTRMHRYLLRIQLPNCQVRTPVRLFIVGRKAETKFMKNLQ